MSEKVPQFEDVELDLSRYWNILVRRRKVFLILFFSVFLLGPLYYYLSPKIYKITMMIQPPVTGDFLPGSNDFESSENMRGMIVHGAFNDELAGKLGLDPQKDMISFDVSIPDKTNILLVSVFRDKQDVSKGISTLLSLCEVISSVSARRNDYRVQEVANLIKQNERAIANARERIANLQQQISEAAVRGDTLKQELFSSKKSIEEMLSKQDLILKNRSPDESSTILLLLANYFQNNSAYTNQVNNQFNELSVRKANLGLEIKQIESQINDLQAAVDKLNAHKQSISDVRIISSPKVSTKPVGPSKAMSVMLSLVAGLFAALTAVFIPERTANNPTGHA